MHEPLIESLRKAIEASPEDVHLRLHLGRLLIESGNASEAITVAGGLLQLVPENADAQRQPAWYPTDVVE